MCDLPSIEAASDFDSGDASSSDESEGSHCSRRRLRAAVVANSAGEQIDQEFVETSESEVEFANMGEGMAALAAKGEWEAGLAPEPLFCFQHIEEIRRHWANSDECWRPFMCKTVLNDPGKYSRGGSIVVPACKNCIKYALPQGFSSETLQRFS